MQDFAAIIRAALRRLESRGVTRYQIVEALKDGEKKTIDLSNLRRFIDEEGELRTDTASKLAAYCGLELRAKKPTTKKAST